METDVVHSLGCFYALENGLHRVSFGNNAHSGETQYVFPVPMKKNNAYLVKKISDTLKEQANAWKNRISSRSLRKGGTTHMTVANIPHFDMVARGGWENPDNSKHYVASSVAANTFRWETSAKFHQFLSPYEQDVMEKMMSKIFICSLSEFYTGGKLRPLLRMCFASLMMYFNTYKDKYGELRTY